MSLTLEEMSAKPKNQILEQMAHSPKISLEQMASKPKIGPAPPSRTLPIPEPEALSYGGHTGFFTDIAEPKEIRETIKQTDPEYERKVQHAISIIESYSPKEQAYILGVLPFTNPLNISTWLSTKGIETPKDMPEGEAHKYTTAALHDAIGRYSQKMKLSDPRKWASIAGLIGKTVLEFRGAPGKSAATRFAARELMTLPTKQEADMPFMDYVISKGERVGEAAAMGYGVGAAHKYIPQAGLRIPAVTGGFMGVTALRGGSPQEILETGATILGFEALGLIEKSTKAVKRTVRNRYATEAVKAARKYNPDLNKLSNKQVEQVLQGIAENRQAMALSSKQAHNEARELVKLAQQQKKAGNRSLFDEVKQVMTKGTGAERDRLLADLYRKTQRPVGPTETTQQAMIAEPQPLTAGRKPVKPTIPTPPAEKIAPEKAAEEIAPAISEGKRRAELGNVNKEIQKHGIYEAVIEGRKEAQHIKTGAKRFYVPKRYRPEVESYAGERGKKGADTALWNKITHDPGKGQAWDDAAVELGWPKDLDTFLQRLQVMGKKAKGPIDEDALNQALKANDPYLDSLVLKRDMLKDGMSPVEINEGLRENVTEGEYGLTSKDIDDIIKEIGYVKEGETIREGLAEKAREEEREKDLLGRPILKGGIAGETAEFLDKEEYRLPEPDIEGQAKFEYEPAKPAEAKGKGKPGFVDLTPVLESHKAFMRVLEPAKAVERKLGKEAYAAVIKGIHATDVARIEFEQKELPKKDKIINDLEGWLDNFPDKDLENLMLSRGDPVSVEAQLIKKDATNKLPKELRSPKLLRAIQHIADFNYKYLQSVVGDDINKVADYFYGIYKNPKKVDKFLDYWRTTKKFTKEKKLPTYADAKAYGLQIRDPNPVRNLKSEYVAIAHLEGMNWLKDELMRTGEGKFIDNLIDAPVEWDKVQDPSFSGLRVQPDLAKLINNLISTNKITKVPALNTLRQINNFLRTVKFIGSAFHLLSVAKQSVADSGYLGFLHKKTATRGITTGFRKNDPIFKTPQYKDYIRHGGGHRYSMESEARKAFVKFANKFNKEFGKAVKYGAIPIKLPVSFVNWMFNNYIPKVKYAKYLDVVAEKEKGLGRPLTSPEKIDIIKEQQNFYGMMNERMFGRSGTWTTVLRLFFMAPGYAEGNFRTILKSALQWKGKDGFRAGRSRANIPNSFLITAALATIGTMILTGKPPKKPETKEDLRDLFKIDTGKTDDKGRRIMIDLMTYDKDYWNVYGNMFLGEPGKAIETSIKRVGGMTATTAEVAADLLLISQGRAVYDWKGDRVTEITDPFLRKVMKLAVYEIKKTEPISWSVFKQSRRKEIDTTIAAVETLLGYRPTMSEKDKREQAITNRIYSLKGQQEKLYQYLRTLKHPRQAIVRYNRTVNNILNSKLVPKNMREEWKPKLLIDLDKYLQGKAHTASLQATTREAKQKVERAIELLKNFGVTAEDADKLLDDYYAREKKRADVSPLERHPVIGRGLKKKRLKERMEGEQ